MFNQICKVLFPANSNWLKKLVVNDCAKRLSSNDGEKALNILFKCKMATKTCTLEHRAIRAMLAGCFTKKQIDKSRQANTNFTFWDTSYYNAKKEFYKLENGEALIVEK